MLKLIYLPLHDSELCLSVWSLRDLENCTSYRRASFTSVKRFSWRVARTVFQAYTTRGSRGEVLTFRQVTCWRPCTGRARTLHFRLPWSGWILPTNWTPLEHSRRFRVEGHTLHITGTIVDICFLREREVHYISDYNTVWYINFAISFKGGGTGLAGPVLAGPLFSPDN